MAGYIFGGAAVGGVAGYAGFSVFSTAFVAGGGAGVGSGIAAGFNAGLLSGMASGAITGGGMAALRGDNVMQGITMGAFSGALSGALGGALMGGLHNMGDGFNFWGTNTPSRYLTASADDFTYFANNYYLPQVTVRATNLIAAAAARQGMNAAGSVIMQAAYWGFMAYTTVGTASMVTGAISRMAASKGGQTIIGETMKRVSIEAAKRPGSVTLNNMPSFTGTADQITSQMMAYNRQWILQQMRSGRQILDIGLDVTRTNPSIFYQMEQAMIKNYLKLHPNAFKILIP
jgi:hypothetical protein